RLADAHFLVTVLESRVERMRRTRAVQDVCVNRAIELLEGVGKALVVPTRVARELRRVGVEQRRVAEQLAIGLASLANPQAVGRLAVEVERLLGTGHLVAQAVLPSGSDLRDRQHAALAALEAKQDSAEVFVVDRHLLALLQSLFLFRRYFF